MSFTSVNFLLFFLAATALVQLSKTVKQQHRVFLLANAVFYAYWDVRFLLLLLGVIGVCYVCARLFESSGKPAFLYGGVHDFVEAVKGKFRISDIAVAYARVVG